MRIVSRGMAITIAALSLAGSASAAPVETVLYSFANAVNGVPVAGLIADKESALYRTTLEGGTAGYGTVFNHDARLLYENNPEIFEWVVSTLTQLHPASPRLSAGTAHSRPHH